MSNNQSRPGHAAQDVTLTNTTAARGSSTAAPQQSQALGSHDFALQITPIQAGSHLFTAEQVCPDSPNSPAGPLHIGPNAPNASAPLLTSSMDITNQTLVGSCMLPPPSGVPKATIAPTHSTVPTHGNSGAGLVDLTNFGSTSSLEVTDSTIHVAHSNSSMSGQISGQANAPLQQTLTMQTRAMDGIFKPKQLMTTRYPLPQALHVPLTTPEPTCYTQAIKSAE